MNNNASVYVNNVPDYARNYKYWVVTFYNGLWFYGAYDEYERAVEASEEVEGRFIVENILMSD